jgi:hypothetical protein
MNSPISHLLPSRRAIRVPARLQIPWMNFPAKVCIAAILAASLLLVQSGNLPLLLAICYALLLGVGGYLWFLTTARDSVSASFVPKLFLGAFALRVAAAIGISMFAKEQVSYDALTYEGFGLQWAKYWHHLIIIQPAEYLPSLHVFDQIVGAQYFVTDNNTFVPDITNAMIGSLIPPILYNIGRRYLGGETVGRAASIFATLQTACIIWSAIVMRDIIILFLGVTLTNSCSSSNACA